MPLTNLVVGDPHCTPEDLQDCEALLELVYATAAEYRAEIITVVGDLHNDHAVLNVRCVDFWVRWLEKLKAVSQKVVVMRGNHDQVTPTQGFPHALMVHRSAGITVVDSPTLIAPGVVAVPYYHDPEEFMVAVRDAHLLAPGGTLFCHQTFDGSRYESGWYAKDGVDPAKLPFPYVVSGHIHDPQAFTAGNVKVLYTGASRWRTRSDANKARCLWLLEHGPEGPKVLKRIPTGDVCARIWCYDDRPGAPAAVDGVAAKDRLFIDVYGPTPEAVRAREAELKASHGARTRGFPDRAVRASVSEAEGVEKSFSKYLSSFKPPFGTAPEKLKDLVEARLGG